MIEKKLTGNFALDHLVLIRSAKMDKHVEAYGHYIEPLSVRVENIELSQESIYKTLISIRCTATNYTTDPISQYDPRGHYMLECDRIYYEYPHLIHIIDKYYGAGWVLEIKDVTANTSLHFMCRGVRIIENELKFEGELIVMNHMIDRNENAYRMFACKTVTVDKAYLVPKNVMRTIENKLNWDSIEKVIFNPPATVILWNDGTKTVVKNSPGDDFDPYFGFVTAYAKHAFGNNSKIKKLLKEKSNIKELKK